MENFMEWAKVREIVERWDNTGLLQNIPNKKSLALCLESQRLFNEEDENGIPMFKRISIPLMRRLFNSGLIEGSLEPCMYWCKIGQLPKSQNIDEEAAWLAEAVQNMTEELKCKFAGSRVFVNHIQCKSDGSIIMNYDITEALTSTADVSHFSLPIGIGTVGRKWPDLVTFQEEDPFFKKKRKRK